MSRCVLNVQSLRKKRVGASGTFIVGLDELVLFSGEFCALVGPSGSGKSTLLDMLALVVEPSDVNRFHLADTSAEAEGGSIEWTSSDTQLINPPPLATAFHDIAKLWKSGDENALALLRRQHLGYVLQAGGLFPFLSVGENIDLPRRLLNMDVKRKHTEARLSQFGLRWGYDKSVSELSGGERQRVAILRALSHNPALVLADEPTAAVDQQRARDIVSLLRQYARESGAAVLMVTHDVELLASGEDRTVLLRPVETGEADLVAYSAKEVIHA